LYVQSVSLATSFLPLHNSSFIEGEHGFELRTEVVREEDGMGKSTKSVKKFAKKHLGAAIAHRRKLKPMKNAIRKKSDAMLHAGALFPPVSFVRLCLKENLRFLFCVQGKFP
jgi:hypothetical protein